MMMMFPTERFGSMSIPTAGEEGVDARKVCGMCLGFAVSANLNVYT